MKWEKYIAKFEPDFWRGFPNKGSAFNAHYDFFARIYQDYMRSIHSFYFNKALEIGIGASGGYLSVIKRIRKRYGLDPLVDELSDLLPFTNRIEYIQGYGEDIPFEDGTFDLVVISNALDHCKDMEAVMSEIKRVLKKGSYFVLFNYLHEDENHPHSFESADEIRNLVNMSIVEEHYIAKTNRWRNRNPYYVAIYRNM